MIYKSNVFTYGEIGERLSGIRESEIYQQSAQKIVNFIINDIGNLKIAKEFEVAPLTDHYKQIFDTKFNFYVAVNNENAVITINKKTYRKMYTLATNIRAINKIKYCDNKLFIITDKTIKVYEFNDTTGQIAESDFLLNVKLPIKNREFLSFDLYKIFLVEITEFENNKKYTETTDRDILDLIANAETVFRNNYKSDYILTNKGNKTISMILQTYRVFLENDIFNSDTQAKKLLAEITDRISNPKTYKKQDYRVVLIDTIKDPNISVREDKIYLAGTNILVSRIYTNFKGNIKIENIDKSFHGKDKYFLVMRYYHKPTSTNKYIVGNSKVETEDLLTDTTYNGKYFTKFKSNEVKGVFTFGELLEINKNFTTIATFQDRMLIADKGYIYLSKLYDTLDFRNGTKTEDAFFFRPNPIENIYPTIYDIYTGDKIYITTDKGVYVLSSNKLSATSFSVFIASEIPSKDTQATIFGDSFFYITTDNTLRSVEQYPTSQSYESYTTTTVEKYSLDNKISGVGKIKYNNKQYLVTYKKDSEELYFYEQLDFKLYRRITLKSIANTEEQLLFLNDKIIYPSQELGIFEGKTNMKKAFLRLNPPPMQTEKGGSYSNDYQSRIERVYIKILNETKEAVKGATINKTLITKGIKDNDIFSVFRLEQTFSVLNGYDIEFETFQNEKVFEILGIDSKVKVYSD